MTIRRVLFVSEERAVSMRPPADSILVSITDPDRPLPAFRPGWTEVLKVQFHDVDETTFPGANPGLQPLTDSQAAKIAAFISRHRYQARRLVVHCRAGISRSAGVAMAAMLELGLSPNFDYSEHNRQVFRQVSDAFRTPAQASSAGLGQQA